MRGKLVAWVLVATLLAMVPATASAFVYSYAPSPSDLNDLDHYYWYTWGIDWNHPGETVTDVVLTITDIYDWRYEEDILNIRLLDDAPLGVTSGYDGQGGGDQFAGQGHLVGSWNDPFGDWEHRTTLTYSLKSLGLVDEFTAYAANDGRFAFSFDPDCHYWNSGVSLDIVTEPVPEPGTLALFGFGLAGGAATLNRRRLAKKK